MTDTMTGRIPHAEVLTERQRRRRWTAQQKLAMVQETYEADATISLVARRHGVQPNQLFDWRELAAQGALTVTSAREEVVAASDYGALQNQVREMQRLFGKKAMEVEILRETLDHTAPKKPGLRLLSSPADGSR